MSYESAKMLFDLWRQARIEATVRNIEPEADQNRPTNLDSVNLAVESTNPDPINDILFEDLGNGPTHPIAGTSSIPVNEPSCSGAVVSNVKSSYPPERKVALSALYESACSTPKLQRKRQESTRTFSLQFVPMKSGGSTTKTWRRKKDLKKKRD